MQQHLHGWVALQAAAQCWVCLCGLPMSRPVTPPLSSTVCSISVTPYLCQQTHKDQACPAFQKESLPPLPLLSLQSASIANRLYHCSNLLEQVKSVTCVRPMAILKQHKLVLKVDPSVDGAQQSSRSLYRLYKVRLFSS